MMRLKAGRPPFEMVDGPMAGHRFEHGRDYAQVPETMRECFEEVPEAPVPARLKRKGGDDAQ